MAFPAGFDFGLGHLALIQSYQVDKQGLAGVEFMLLVSCIRQIRLS